MVEACIPLWDISRYIHTEKSAIHTEQGYIKQNTPSQPPFPPTNPLLLSLHIPHSHPSQSSPLRAFLAAVFVFTLSFDYKPADSVSVSISAHGIYRVGNSDSRFWKGGRLGRLGLGVFAFVLWSLRGKDFEVDGGRGLAGSRIWIESGGLCAMACFMHYAYACSVVHSFSGCMVYIFIQLRETRGRRAVSEARISFISILSILCVVQPCARRCHGVTVRHTAGP
jgi:hypothetical protein